MDVLNTRRTPFRPAIRLPVEATRAARGALFAAAGSLLILLLVAGPAVAQQTTRAIQATRVDAPPKVDGALDDDAWRGAQLVTEFVQQEPDEGQGSTERTIVRVVTDGVRLYLAFEVHQADPTSIIATEMRRDSERILQEDNIQVVLDTFRDSRSAYMFVTNPLGAKLDQQVFEEGDGGRRGASSNINRDWDPVWDVAAIRTTYGWSAEIAIPYSTLRFPDGSDRIWGINFMRNIAFRNEQAFWSPVPKGFEITRVSHAGQLAGLGQLSRGRDVRIKPFVIGSGRQVLANEATTDRYKGDAGLDVRLGVTAGLNLELTYNTDFAQAEIDDERVNLTRFALYYPEKRDFFLENAGQFNVGAMTSQTRTADLFFSRRIGLSSTGASVPIIGGARLTGKVGSNNVAVLNVQTDEAFGAPGENFLVARYSRDVFGRSKIGALAINRQAMEGGGYNRTLATDLTLALGSSYTVNGFLARTLSPGVEDGEYGGYLRIGKFDRTWNVYAEYTDLQDNFNPEVGFVPQVGIRTTKVHLERTPRPGRFGIRLMEPMFNVSYTTDQNNALLTRRYHYMLGTRMENGSYFIVWYNQTYERLDRDFSIRPGIRVPAGRYNFGDWRFSGSTNPARRFYASAAYMPQTFWDGERTDYDARLGVRANSKLSAEAQYSRNEVRLPDRAAPGDREFTADIGSMRLDYAISPVMTLRGLTQYNWLTEQWSTSARFHYIFRPGSDFYVVYNELQRDPRGLSEFRDRHLILKMSYLLAR
jgi:hypothetical protein